MHTKERDAWRVGKMQTFPVLSKILSASHQSPHLLKDSNGPSWNLIPGSLETMNWGCT